MAEEGMPERQLKIGWSWGETHDGWVLHREIKDPIWRMLEGGKFDLKVLISLLKVKEEWLDVLPGEKAPANYAMLYFIWKHYKNAYKKMQPSLLWRVGITKIAIITLTLYKEDSAYTERIGGAIQYMIEHKEDWIVKDKEARLLCLHDLRNWWWEEDWRQRGKERLSLIFDYVIEQYEKDAFVQKSLDFWIDNILANADKWNAAGGFFKPEFWYPRRKGIVNYLVHGRQS
jgi:hypothetical protein